MGPLNLSEVPRLTLLAAAALLATSDATCANLTGLWTGGVVLQLNASYAELINWDNLGPKPCTLDGMTLVIPLFGGLQTATLDAACSSMTFGGGDTWIRKSAGYDFSVMHDGSTCSNLTGLWHDISIANAHALLAQVAQDTAIITK